MISSLKCSRLTSHRPTEEVYLETVQTPSVMATTTNFVEATLEIPENMIFEILLRLPVKSLLRLKAVCKMWYTLIKSPNFVFMHHKFNLGRLSNLLVCTAPKFEQYKFINHHMFSIGPDGKSTSADLGMLKTRSCYVEFTRGSFNGIVCYFDDCEIFLSNPATREFKQLPPTPFETNEKFFQYGIAFGFGCGSTNIYDFKVCQICVALNNETRIIKPTHEAFKAEMYTLSSNSWKQLQWGLNDNIQFVKSPIGSFCANSFHFLATRCNSQKYARTIVCCDIHTERFRTMELPSLRGGSYLSLIAHPDFLSVVCNKFPELPRSEQLMEVWIMKDYGVVASWTKLYSIGQHGVPRFFWTEKNALVLQVETFELVLRNHDTINYEPLWIDGYNNKFSQSIVYQETLVSIM